MKTTSFLAISFFTVATIFGSATESRAQAFDPGDILLTNFGGSRMERYGSDGILKQNYTGTGSLWFGSGLTPDGNFVTSHRGPTVGINVFSPSGVQLSTFDIGGFGVNDVSVFANGTLALSGNPDSLRLYSQSGTSLGTVTIPGATSTVGSTLGRDNILYVSDGSGNIAKVDQNGNYLGSIALSFDPGDLVMSTSDGTLWGVDRGSGRVHHFTVSGAELSSFATPIPGGSFFYSIGLAPDDNSLYLTAVGDTGVRHVGLDGSLIETLSNNVGGSYFITVVGVPEPATAATGLLLLATTLVARRRKA